MASIEENREHWQRYDWPRDGEEWSEVWGGSEIEWGGSILPRVERWLPAATALEIGCGKGRWSRYLRPRCQRLILLDLAEVCVEACGRLFSGDSAVTCRLTDGVSLPRVPSGSVDFAFSFDSLVHAELDVLAAYARELARVLTADGVAFLHHSNMAEALAEGAGVQNLHWRAESVGCRAVASAAEAAGLAWLRQEIVDWGGVRDGDCFTTLCRPQSRVWSTPIRLWNHHFMGEAQSLAIRGKLYRR
jgi:SAM-dependent methyltransferase